jgi:antitoxin ParD1/3/4
MIMADAVTVTLGGMGERARKYIAEGRYASMSEVVRAGLRALDREEEMLDSVFKAKMLEALADDRPGIPFDEAFEQVQAALPKKG